MSRPVNITPGSIELTHVSISLAASGGVILGAQAGRRPMLFSIVLNMAGGAQTITFRDGTGLLSGAMDVANDGMFVLPWNPNGWFRPGGKSLDMNIVAVGATLIAGHALAGWRDW